jgi:ribosomal protein S27E
MKNHIVKDLGLRSVGKSKQRFALVKCPECGSVDERRVRADCKPRCRSCAMKAIRESKGPSKSGTEGDTSKNHVNNRLYRIWRGVYRRCYDPEMTGYSIYGAKGVTMCDSWKNSYKAFKQWALCNGYTDELVIDKDELCELNNVYPKVYSPETCVWKPVRENSKTNEKLPEKDLKFVANSLDNKEQTAEYFANLYGISRKQVLHRTKGLRLKRYSGK